MCHPVSKHPCCTSDLHPVAVCRRLLRPSLQLTGSSTSSSTGILQLSWQTTISRCVCSVPQQSLIGINSDSLGLHCGVPAFQDLVARQPDQRPTQNPALTCILADGCSACALNEAYWPECLCALVVLGALGKLRMQRQCAKGFWYLDSSCQ